MHSFICYEMNHRKIPSRSDSLQSINVHKRIETMQYRYGYFKQACDRVTNVNKLENKNTWIKLKE